MAQSHGAFKPALVVVDFQEDFCPPVRRDHTSRAERESSDNAQRMALSLSRVVEILRL